MSRPNRFARSSTGAGIPTAAAAPSTTSPATASTTPASSTEPSLKRCSPYAAAAPPGIDEETTILLEFSGGGTAEIAVGFSYHGTQYVEVHGTGGRLRADKAWNNENQPTAIDAEFAAGSARFDFAPVYQFALQMQNLRDCLERGGEYRIPPRNSLGQMRAIDAVFASMERGAPVRPGG